VRGNETKNKLRDLASAADLIVKSFDFRCQTLPVSRECEPSLVRAVSDHSWQPSNEKRFRERAEAACERE
jgi:hypothetical protein